MAALRVEQAPDCHPDEQRGADASSHLKRKNAGDRQTPQSRLATPTIDRRIAVGVPNRLARRAIGCHRQQSPFAICIGGQRRYQRRNRTRNNHPGLGLRNNATILALKEIDMQRIGRHCLAMALTAIRSGKLAGQRWHSHCRFHLEIIALIDVCRASR